MRIERHRYHDRRGLLRLRRAVVVTDRGLLQEFALGQSRLTLWSQVRGVRWLRHGQAEVQLADGRAIRLPDGLDDIEQLVDAIEAEASETQREWREQGIPVAQMCDWLDIEPGGAWHYNPNPGLVLLGVVLTLASVIMPFLAGPAGFVGIVWLIAGILLIVAGAMASQPVVSANTRRITWQRGSHSWTVDWRHVTHAEVTTSGGKNPVTTIRLATHGGPRELRGPAGAFARLAETAERVAEANTARFMEAGDEPIPDTALSPARMTELPDAERGLSQVGE